MRLRIYDQPSIRHSRKRGASEPDKTIGYDAGKKVKGRKRHIAVDTLGLIWAVRVTAASVQDRDGALLLLPELEAQSQRLETLYADAAYAGGFEDALSYLSAWKVKIVKKLDDQKGFVVLPKRWMVERTLSWLSKCRRLSKDYEFETESSEAIILWASIRRMAQWLTKPYT